MQELNYTVDTPENIDVAYDVAGIGSRFMAAIIDTFLLVVLQIILGALSAFIANQIDTPDARSVINAIWALLSFLFLWGYYMIFELIWNGQSPGKRLLGLRVVREGGRPITLVASAIRNLVRIIDFLPGLYGIGVLAMFIDKRARRLGDLAAGTLVVKNQQALSLDSLTAEPALAAIPPRPSDAPDTPLLPNLHLVSQAEFDLVNEFLRRRNELGPEPRFRLGSDLAGKLRSRLGVGNNGHHELFLEHFVREFRVSRTKQSLPE